MKPHQIATCLSPKAERTGEPGIHAQYALARTLSAVVELAEAALKHKPGDRVMRTVNADHAGCVRAFCASLVTYMNSLRWAIDPHESSISLQVVTFWWEEGPRVADEINP